MLWTIFVVLLILWLLGFSLHVAGGKRSNSALSRQIIPDHRDPAR